MNFAKNNLKPEQFGFTNKQFNEIMAVFSAYPQIDKAVLFGSRAKGTYKTGSDVDIVISGKDLTIEIVGHIQADFENSTLPYFFDVLNFDSIDSDELLQHIKEHGVVIYENCNDL